MKLLWFFLLTYLASAPFACARYIRPFDLDYSVGESKVIVHGMLDAQGEVTVIEVFGKHANLGPKLKLYGGNSEYEYLQRVIGGSDPIEVMVFLNDDGTADPRTLQRSPGFVGFKGNDVILIEDDDFQPFLQKSRRFTKTSFLVALGDAIKRKQEREQILALPRSAERTTRLITFAVQSRPEDDPTRRSRWDDPVDYELEQIARALKNPTPQEQATLLDALRSAKMDTERIVVLNLARWIPLASDSMDPIASFLPRTNPPRVREAAMDALSAIDGYKAVDYLVPYLVLDDPQLAAVLYNLGSHSYPPEAQLPNIHAVDALKKLAESMTGPDEVPIENGYEIGAVTGQLCHYLHPKLIPLLYARAINGDGPCSRQVFVEFSSTLGLKYAQEDKASWEAWWKKAQPLLEGDFDLQTADGRELWLDHYSQADPATQKILMGLWLYERTVDETALIEGAEKSEAAKQVLADLWRREHLSEGGKQVIIRRFVKSTLINDPPRDAVEDKSWYGVSLDTVSSFPFPDRAIVRQKVMVTLGDKVYVDDGLTPKTVELYMLTVGKVFHTMAWTAQLQSPPQAHASIEYRGLDFPHSWNELWTIKFDVDAIQLSNTSR